MGPLDNQGEKRILKDDGSHVKKLNEFFAFVFHTEDLRDTPVQVALFVGNKLVELL